VKRLLPWILVTAFTAWAGVASAATDALFAATLNGSDDKPVALETYRGKPLLVNFWARWCAPCRKEIPELVQLQSDYGNQGLNVVGIAIEDDTTAVREFLKAYSVTYPVGVNQKKGIWLMQGLGNDGALLPFTLAIDRKGEIVMRKIGAFKKTDFEQVADKLLQ